VGDAVTGVRDVVAGSNTRPASRVGVVADLEGIASDIRRHLPGVRSGSLVVYGDIFGGRIDNIHVLVSVTGDDEADCLSFTFNEGELLQVWNPRGVSISDREFRIQRAARVRWEWFYYGRPRTPANLRVIEHRVTAAGVEATTDFDPSRRRFAPTADRPAVELLG